MGRVMVILNLDTLGANKIKKSSKRDLTPHKNYIKKEIINGQSLNSLADQFDTTPSKIQYFITRETGITVNQLRKVTAQRGPCSKIDWTVELDKIEKMINTGFTIPDIANMYGVSERAIYTGLKRWRYRTDGN
jgi:hypothetical protein